MAYTEFRTDVLKPVEIYKEAWELIKGQYWMVFAVVLVGMIIGSAIPVVLIGPMVCGIYLVLFGLSSGEPVDFGRLFKGFDYFMPSLGLAVIITVPTFVLIFSVYIPMFLMAMAGPRMSESEMIAAIAGIVAVEIVIAIVMVCIHTLLLFSFPLIVDKKMGTVDSIKTSARAVWHNLSGVVGLFVVGFVVCLVGYLALCVGIYLAIPLVIAANMVAYRKVFPASPAFSA
ncbi:MAG: hypothetical protein AB7F88_17475 [Pyrinomonadaceae bacterium]